MKRMLFVAALAALHAAPGSATVVTARGGAALKPFQVTAFVPVAYSRTAKFYDWSAGEYQPLDDTLRTGSFGADVIVGVGLPFRFELCGVLPVATKGKGDNTSSGVGDAMAMVRWGVLQTALLPVRVSLIGAVNLPTAQEGASPALGDRTVDAGLGFAANTVKLGLVAGHLRAGYWMNGKDANGKQAGNFLEYVGFVETPLRPAFAPYLGLAGVVAGRIRVNGVQTDNTERSQHSLIAGITSKPVGFLPLWLRPKASLPLAGLSEGGELPNFTVGLDFWTVLP